MKIATPKKTGADVEPVLAIEAALEKLSTVSNEPTSLDQFLDVAKTLEGEELKQFLSEVYRVIGGRALGLILRPQGATA